MKTACIMACSMNTSAGGNVKRHIAIGNHPLSRYMPLCGKHLTGIRSWVFERDITPTCKKCLEVEGKKIDIQIRKSGCRSKSSLHS